jgi:prophage regulatory protein
MNLTGVKMMNTVTVRILRLPDVKQLVGLSRSEIYRRMNLNEFPKSVSLGKRSIGWIETEINEWIVTRIKLSRQEEASIRHAA